MSNRMLKTTLATLVILFAALLYKSHPDLAAAPKAMDKRMPVVEALMAQLPVKDSSAVACTEPYDRRHYHYSAPKLRKMLATTRDSNRSIYTGHAFCLYGPARLMRPMGQEHGTITKTSMSNISSRQKRPMSLGCAMPTAQRARLSRMIP